MQKSELLLYLEEVRRGGGGIELRSFHRLNLVQFLAKAGQSVQAEIVDNAVDPGGELGMAPESLQSTPCAHESFLGDVLRFADIPQHAVGRVKDISLVPDHQLLEGRFVALLGPRNQNPIALDHISSTIELDSLKALDVSIICDTNKTL
jgi:hypothetical protein